MKKYLIISLLALTFSVTLVYAASTDFTANGDITVSGVVGSGVTADLTIFSGSRAESWTFNGSLQVTNADSVGRFKVGSSDANVISMRVKNNAGVDLDCVNGLGGVEVTPGSGDPYTVYPSSVVCSSRSTGTSGSSGGGGSSSRPAVPAIPAVPTINPAIPAIPALSALINASPRAAFNRTLTMGAVHEDARNLQRFLNTNDFTVATTGAGSPGKETNVFGPATKAALIKFQLSKGVIQSVADSGAGILGPKTRAKINELAGNVSVQVQAPVIATQSQTQLNQLLEVLRRLQTR